MGAALVDTVVVVTVDEPCLDWLPNRQWEGQGEVTRAEPAQDKEKMDGVEVKAGLWRSP